MTKKNETSEFEAQLALQNVSECVAIMLHDCSPEGMKTIKDNYDVVDCNSGIILFTGTGEECKAKYPNYVKPIKV